MYEVIEGTPPVIQDLQVPFISSSDPLLTFKRDNDGRYIIQAYISGVHRYNGVSWDLLGMPNVVQPGAPPFADLQRYSDLPFVIVAANNTQGLVPGIYCYLDIPRERRIRYRGPAPVCTPSRPPVRSPSKPHRPYAQRSGWTTRAASSAPNTSLSATAYRWTFNVTHRVATC